MESQDFQGTGSRLPLVVAHAAVTLDRVITMFRPATARQLLAAATRRRPAMVLLTLTWWWTGWHVLVSGG